jgi:transmembrane sensor
MTQDEFRQLLRRYKEGNCSAEELRKIDVWFGRIADDDRGLPEWEKSRMRQKMLRNMRPHLKGKERALRADGWRVWKIAASVAAIMLAGYFFLDEPFVELPPSKTVERLATDLRRIQNTTQEVLGHSLPDGSSVELQPGSQIFYEAKWSGQEREVHLIGDAFFQVVHDPTKPFFVYGGEVITKVLGTSFRVIAPEFGERIEVEVRTGKVSVYEAPSKNAIGKTTDGSGVILTPNEKVQYYVKAGHWVTSLVDSPQPFSGDKDAKTGFIFSGTPVKEVFRYIETGYNIDIIIENESTYTCTFTGDVGKMELYTMLQVICRSIDATYEVKGTKILITGNGCVQN